MGKRIEFRLSGSGGQGVISAGIILAAAAVADGKHAIQSQSYGPEARGGASKAEVIISDEPIDYPKATTPEYVLCLTDEAFRLYGKTADEKTVIFPMPSPRELRRAPARTCRRFPPVCFPRCPAMTIFS
jgi:2-oxoglutarate ferredoxin oxidoreductase subunit gamma